MNRAFLTAPIAIALSAGLLFAAAGPAAAKEDNCSIQASELRTAAAAAETDVARQALRHVKIGVQLCEAGNDRAAEKKFVAATRVLGIGDEQQLAAKAK